MTLTVEQVIELDVVQLARPKLVAGRAGLQALVRWVHISDFPEIATGLHGGELLLTAGSRIKDEPAAQRRFIASLVQAGVAGVMLEAGDQYHVVPSAMEVAAERHDLPLILLREPTPYVDITERVHAAIVNTRYEEMRSLQLLSRDLTDLALNGARPKQIVWRLFQAIGSRVVLEDAAHNVIEWAAEEGDSEGRHEAWATHARLPYHAQRNTEPLAGDSGDCVWVDVSARSQVWGRLHAFDVDGESAPEVQLQLDLGAATIALTLAGSQEATSWADQERSLLLQDIIRGSNRSRDELAARARHLGVPLDRGAIFVLALESGTANVGWARAGQTASSLLRITRSILERAGVPGICSEYEGRVVVLGVSRNCEGRSVHELAARVATRIREDAEVLSEGHGVTVGICADLGIAEVQQALGRADMALRYGVRASRDGGVFDFSSLGFQQLLLRLGEGPELALLVEAELGLILAHDARTGSALTETLRAVLAAPSATDAARTLQLQRRSLYHRLDKVRELLGCDLHDPETRVRLLIALEARNFLQSDGAVRQSASLDRSTR